MYVYWDVSISRNHPEQSGMHKMYGLSSHEEYSLRNEFQLPVRRTGISRIMKHRSRANKTRQTQSTRKREEKSLPLLISGCNISKYTQHIIKYP